MKRFIIILPVLALIISSCNNQDPGLDADVEIPVSVEDIKLKSIEEFVSTTGTVYPMVDAEQLSEIAGRYYLEDNPSTGRPWQLGDKIRKGALLARLEDEEYTLSDLWEKNILGGRPSR